MYKLEDQTYRLQIGEPYWMPEVGLGIGRGRQVIGGVEQEVRLWLCLPMAAYLSIKVIGGVEQEVRLWSDAQAKAHQTPEEVIQDMQAARQRAERLAAYVRSLGVDPDNLPEITNPTNGL